MDHKIQLKDQSEALEKHRSKNSGRTGTIEETWNYRANTEETK